jgi:hypothetical protein
MVGGLSQGGDLVSGEMNPGEEAGTRLSLAGTGIVNSRGSFEILAITSGEGNGWTFSDGVLRDSLALWEGVECFVDHGSWFTGRKVKDLCGVGKNPRWSDEDRGIKLDLQALGPCGDLVTELGREILEAEEPRPKVGFSADLIFKGKGREVTDILRILDLSLVFNPARGGAFVRAMNSVFPGLSLPGTGPNYSPASLRDQDKEVNKMTQNDEVLSTTPGQSFPGTGQTATTPGYPPGAGYAGGPAEELKQEKAAIEELNQAQEERQRLADEAEDARQIRIAMCANLLDSTLLSSKLPDAMQSHVRKQFTGRVFTPGELDQAIEDSRSLVSELQGAGTVQGPQFSHMYTTEEQLQAAVDDMLGAPRDEGSEGLSPARLSGIKELYMLMTGDRNLYGGYYPQNIQLATTANFTGLVKNALNKIVADQWRELGRAGYDWWYRVTKQEHFENLNTVTGTLVGTVGTLPSVAEGAEYTELKVGDSPETASFTKYGGYIPLTLELIDRDNTRKLALYPYELAKAGIRRISGLVAAVFTDNSGIGPTMADTGALFNATAVTTAGGHANLLTTALAAAEWEVVSTAVYSQPMLIANETGYYGTGAAMALDPRYCLVPRELRLTAMQILYPEWERTANIHSENMQRGASGDVVVVPEWTDATDWAAVVDPSLVPGIVVCERFGLLPEIFIAGDELSPAVFMNDEHRIKVRHFVAVLVQDFRPLHKSNVAG